MIDFLVDTNVLIYLYTLHPTYLHFFLEFADKIPGISVVTHMEMLMGARNDKEEAALEKFLGDFESIPVDLNIARESALWMRRRKHRSLRHPSLPDTIIGKTALALGIPLVTNNKKDFASLAGLELIVPE